MKKPSNYDNVPIVHAGEYETLKPGGYICVIKKALIEKSKNGNEMLVLLFDIAEGEKKGFYSRRFNESTQKDRKWKGVFRQVTEGNFTMFLRGIIQSIEDSNANFKFNFDETQFVGKLFGGLFGEVEYYDIGKGSYQLTTMLRFIRSVDIIKSGDFKIPEVKLADRTQNNAPSSNNASSNFFDTSQPVDDDDDLPF